MLYNINELLGPLQEVKKKMSSFNSQIHFITRGFSPRTTIRWGLQWMVVLALLTGLFLSPVQPVQTVKAQSTIPTFSIVSVNPNVTVTVQTYNFPPNQLFTVRMGPYGTLGIGGVVVAQTNSGAGGSFQETYAIPASLVGSYQIAIRMDSDFGYYAYNWFYNQAPVSPTAYPTTIPGTGYSGIPTFSIQAVVRDSTVTILTNNFPANQDFTVRMGPYGTLGVGGIVVATTNSGAGGAFQATYAIPSSLYGSYQIAIRMDSNYGYYAYNWFYNNTVGGPTVTPGGPTTVPPTGYTGYPTFNILGVVQNSSVTVQTYNFPPNQTFTVRMGPYGTLGIGGIVVATFDSGAGGAFQATYAIPAALAGSYQIAIRMDSNMGYYAYNWFYNSSTGTTAPTSTPVTASTAVPTVTPGGPTAVPTITTVPSTAVPTTIPGTGYGGIPSFSVTAVVQNQTVTILTNNYPPNQDFTVRMGQYGTLGIGGIVVATTNSGAGGAFQATYAIPAQLQGLTQIAIRMDSNYGYYAYNWFWNSTYP
jgi:hypothetical protein